MMAFFLLVAWLFAMPAWGQVGLSPEGTWVSAATRRLAQSGEGGDPGCFLQISEEGWVVEENCSEIPTRGPPVMVASGKHGHRKPAPRHEDRWARSFVRGDVVPAENVGPGRAIPLRPAP